MVRARPCICPVCGRAGAIFLVVLGEIRDPMPDAFSIRSIPSLDVPIGQLDRAGRSLRDFSDFWPLLGRAIADKAQSSWPLRRRSGRLRRSLTWAAGRAGLGRGGIYEADPDALVIGTGVFYARFSHHATVNQRKRVLLSVDPGDTTARLEKWARSRVQSSGLEVL